MTEITQADRDLFNEILNPDSSTAESVRQGRSYTWEVGQIARHREQAEQETVAKIVAWLRGQWKGRLQSPVFLANAIEAGEWK